MPFKRSFYLVPLSIFIFIGEAFANSANRLTYLDGTDPFYPGLHFSKLTTPQWVGESNVEAVIILGIDDMRDPAKYEAFLRPVLERLKQIDGRAPVSIFCNALDPAHPQLQAWLKEGLSLENHTLSHPCPCLAKGDFAAAANTYHGGVDLLHRVPGNKPVAYRMPCCDSMNSPSPRFYAEIFNSTNSAGQFLTIDSSVMNIPTANDTSLPRDLVVDKDGRPRFEKYLPTETNATTRVSMKSFTTTIRDYPYPYVMGALCWQFPGAVPSDWEAHNLHGSTNSVTVADWKAALDITVLKQGVFNFIFHPHGWVRADQMIEFIDYAFTRYGPKVKFLNFREAQGRLDQFLLAGHSVRGPDGSDKGIRLIDLNDDGYLDVVIGNAAVKKSRIWDGSSRTWRDQPFPTTIDPTLRFGIVDGAIAMLRLATGEKPSAAWRFKDSSWVADATLLRGLRSRPLVGNRDVGLRLRDVDNDGQCELIISNPSENTIYTWSGSETGWKKLPFALPAGVTIVDAQGRDNGLRFVDFNADGFDDIIYSNPESYGLYLFLPQPKEDWRFEVGWTRRVRYSKRTDNDPYAIPMIVRAGPLRDNGAWFASRHMWIQNEDTAHLPDKVDRRSFAQLLAFDSPPPKSPEESLRCLKVHSDFRAELVAAEPLVVDPVAFDWGPDGRLWVVEMIDYPTGTDGRGKPGGRVRFLEDTNHDGRYDKSTLFLSDLNFPTGVMPWRNGVLVSAAPEVFYAEDRNGDGKADHRVTLLEGFGEGNQQHRVNGFEYGLDNWVYVANGDSGGTIRSIGGASSVEPHKSNPINLRGQDFRFRPDHGAFEAIEGQTQFGRRRDDWGNWFGNNNPVWGWHYWIAQRYAARNPDLAVRSMRQPLANYKDASRVFAISPPLQRFNWPNLVNIVTSANSLTPCRDDRFGPDFEASVFISEPAHNLVHREQLIPKGVTFDSRRPADETNSEFVASTDSWFRPTMLKTGPDGALYIADMYRLVIEHTEYALPGMENQIDVRAGADRGRIYRIVPKDKPLRRFQPLDPLNTAALVAALDSPNGWQRDTAQRLLVHAQDKAAVSPLRKLFASTTNAKTRLHTLYTLDGLGALQLADLRTAWTDPHPLVRAHAVQLSESPSLTGDFSPMFALAADPDIRVRYQLALTAGESKWPAEQAGQALALIAARDPDAYMQTALMSSAPSCFEAFVESFERLAQPSTLNPQLSVGPSALAVRDQLLRLATARDHETAIAAILRSALSSSEPLHKFSLVHTFLESLARRRRSLTEFQQRCSPPLRELLKQIPNLRAAAETVAFASAASDTERANSIQFLGRLGESQTLGRLADLLAPTQPVAVQKAALGALANSPDADASPEDTALLLIQKWPQLSPNTRHETIELLLSRRQWANTLLAALAAGQLPASQITATVRQRLLKHRDDRVRDAAAAIFAKTAADRHQLIQQFRDLPSGDPARGQSLFAVHCAPCHRFKDQGVPLGPDLAAITDKSPGSLLVALLDPNQSVEAPFVNYTVLTHDGRELSGIIVSETTTGITLRLPGGAEHVLLRKDLKELTSSGLSLMPEGLEQALDRQQMADLIEYVLAE